MSWRGLGKPLARLSLAEGNASLDICWEWGCLQLSTLAHRYAAVELRRIRSAGSVNRFGWSRFRGIVRIDFTEGGEERFPEAGVLFGEAVGVGGHGRVRAGRMPGSWNARIP